MKMSLILMQDKFFKHFSYYITRMKNKRNRFIAWSLDREELYYTLVHRDHELVLCRGRRASFQIPKDETADRLRGKSLYLIL